MLVCSCGYHLQDSAYEEEMRRTISIPYIKGDVRGQLTNEIIRQLSYSGRYEYIREGGSLLLKVAVVSDGTSKIGYRYDRKNHSCKRTNHLQPTEARREITVELTLIDEASMMEIIKPTLVRGTSEYDFVGTHSLCDLSFIQGGRRVTVESFSLGQLDSVEGAQDDALLPLYRDLAEKIVNGLEWISC